MLYNLRMRLSQNNVCGSLVPHKCKETAPYFSSFISYPHGIAFFPSGVMTHIMG